MHRKGKRFLHETKNLDGTKFDCTQNVIKGSDNNKTVYANTGASAAATADAQANTSSSQSSAPISDATTNDQMQQDPQVKENKTDDNATTNTTHTANGTNATNATNATTDDAPMSTDDNNDNSNTEKQEYVLPADPPRNDWFEEDPTPEWFLRRSQTIPMRLTEAERQLLKVIEASLDVSEYTDKIDIYMYHNKAGRITEQLEEICRYICGLKICQDFRKGRAQMLGKEYKDNNEFLCDVFEIARRHKIRNPDKMRTTYGRWTKEHVDSVHVYIHECIYVCARCIHRVYAWPLHRLPCASCPSIK